LWRSLRVYQIYGANTDVGKTVFSTILSKAARRLWRTEQTTFLKPVSTGATDAADDRCMSFSFTPLAGFRFFKLTSRVCPSSVDVPRIS
jgi:dethiobiotin synthetase